LGLASLEPLLGFASSGFSLHPPCSRFRGRSAPDLRRAPVQARSRVGLQRFASERSDRPLSRSAHPLEVSSLLASSRSRVRQGQLDSGDRLRSPTSFCYSLSLSLGPFRRTRE